MVTLQDTICILFFSNLKIQLFTRKSKNAKNKFHFLNICSILLSCVKKWYYKIQGMCILFFFSHLKIQLFTRNLKMQGLRISYYY